MLHGASDRPPNKATSHSLSHQPPMDNRNSTSSPRYPIEYRPQALDRIALQPQSPCPGSPQFQPRPESVHNRPNGDDEPSRFHIEKHATNYLKNARGPQRSSPDPEKASTFERRSTFSTNSIPPPFNPTKIPCNENYDDTDDEDEDADANGPERHTLWILIHLSFLSPFLSLLIALYTLLTLTLTLLLSPLTPLTHRTPTQYLSTFLAPLLHLQLQLIYHHHHHPPPSPTSPTTSSTTKTTLTHLLSPLYALPIMFAAWVSGAFWVVDAILGNPAGRRDEGSDGKAAVLGVRRWWEKWLLWGLG